MWVGCLWAVLKHYGWRPVLKPTTYYLLTQPDSSWDWLASYSPYIHTYIALPLYAKALPICQLVNSTFRTVSNQHDSTPCSSQTRLYHGNIVSARGGTKASVFNVTHRLWLAKQSKSRMFLKCFAFIKVNFKPQWAYIGYFCQLLCNHL